ncbi:OmpA family protein [Flavobacterium phragmitis]|uniref:Outer membrane protein OmpA n=1 Tax=Flavobacterium phragmitis TaxID=739143 RepID=A0A1I1X457_9FLAO|nr:OmpA family protein [Flavobacterium phragmitis]SFE02186.1 Outer membrane protein OmpA [Flavobacterium phragmitis]
MKIKITIALLILFNVTIKSQELNVKINGGPSGILYDSTIGNGTLKFGGGIGIGYTYFFSNHWGVSTGIDVMYNQNSFKLNEGNTINSYEVDDQTSAFEYRVTPSKYKEDQHFISAAIPLLVQYRTAFASNTQWYLGFGGKMLFSGKQTVKASADQLQLSGYYPDLNLLIDDLPSHGFGQVNSWKDETKTSLDPSFLLSLETGLTFKIKEKTQLYTGLYVDYGLTNLAKETPDLNIVAYDPNGIDNTQANGTIGNKRIVQDTRYLSAGVQLKLGFSLAKNKPQPAQQKTETVTQKEEVPVQEPPVQQKIVETAPVKKELTTEERNYIEKKPLAFQEVGSTSVTPELAARLDEIAQILKSNQDTDLNITGYTCDIGTKARNLEIGMQRAQAVAYYLKNKGIASSRMHLFSKGESEPLVPNMPAENKPLNRRVSLILVDGK